MTDTKTRTRTPEILDVETLPSGEDRFLAAVQKAVDEFKVYAQPYNPAWMRDQMGEAIRLLAIEWMQSLDREPEQRDVDYITMYLDSALESETPSNWRSYDV